MKLYRPLNKAELDLIQQSGWKRFPPRLSEQPYFYPVLNIEYAREITQKWNLPAYGSGYIVAFEVADDFIQRYAIKTVGASHHQELWIPAEELEECNDHIIGIIELTEQY